MYLSRAEESGFHSGMPQDGLDSIQDKSDSVSQHNEIVQVIDS